jgi:hypothetical protein
MKPETQNRRLDPQVDGYGFRSGPARVSGSGFWPGLEPNRPVVAVQTRTAGGLPGPVANTINKHTMALPSSWTTTKHMINNQPHDGI